ncbi:MAG: hypothetical protein WBG86_23010 [Polyangiales bacterium]
MSALARVLSFVVAFFVITQGASAQLGPNGTPIDTSNYTVDLTRGVVIGTSRVTGLAGAATSLAQGVEGGLENPAAVAWRGPQWPEWYDYWLALGLTVPLSSGDFYNSGRVLGEQDNFKDDDLFFLIPGAYWQMWNFGIGLAIDAQFVSSPGVVNPATQELGTLRLRFTTFHIQVGYGFLDGQVILGGGLRILRQRAFFSSRQIGPGKNAYSSMGLGAEVGLIVQPHGKRWRLGASLYPQMGTGLRTQGDLDDRPGSDQFFLPESTKLPTTGSMGFSYQFGPRPPNPAWVGVDQLAAADLERLARRERGVREAELREIDEARARSGADAELELRMIEQRYARKYAQIKRWRKQVKKQAWEVIRNRYRNEWPRRYHLLAIDLSFTGRLSDAVGVESFIFQTVQRSGEKMTFTPRIGYETEFWPRRMKGRFGSYVEPTRFASSSARVHTTFGIDINVLKWNVFGIWPDDYRWQISASLDVAAQYQAFSLGIGGWY